VKKYCNLWFGYNDGSGCFLARFAFPATLQDARTARLTGRPLLSYCRIAVAIPARGSRFVMRIELIGFQPAGTKPAIASRADREDVAIQLWWQLGRLAFVQVEIHSLKAISNSKAQLCQFPRFSKASA
jgi:hypothetical protein